jgi:hypothetical protein
MSQDTPASHMTKKRVVYDMPGTDAVVVRKDLEFRAADGDVLAMDLYCPSGPQTGTRAPLVIIVAGYPDAGFQKVLGCRYKEMAWTACWGRLVAASGMAAIAYTNRDPVTALHGLFDDVRRNTASLGVDENRIGVLACSGNAPLALSLLMQDSGVRIVCAAFCYGLMLDLDGATGVADAARAFGFVNPCAGRSFEDLRKDVPFFLARAGQDEMPRLNETLDRFVAGALASNLPITLTNHATGPHAFDLLHDSAASREAVRQTLAFLRSHLG